MICKFPEEVIERAIVKAFELGAKHKSIELGEEPAFISQRKAYRTYGKGNVDRWVKLGVVKKRKDSKSPNASVRYSVSELEKAAYTINVTTKLSPMSQGEMREIISEELTNKNKRL